MKFSMFKKDKKENKKIEAVEEDDVQLTDLEEELNNRTSNLKEKQRQLESLSADGEQDAAEEEHAAPHGPIEELTIDPSEQADTQEPVAAIEAEAPPEDSGEEINVVEVTVDAVPISQEASTEAAPPPPPEEEKKDESMGSSFNSLFQSEEEEENPLANLIKGLPDVSAEELVKDLNEIKDIIKEWQKKT